MISLGFKTLFSLVISGIFGNGVAEFRDQGCFEKWLQGYRLASGHPQRTFSHISLERCQEECERERGCAALAYGISSQTNGTCELAIRNLRDSRSVSNTSLAYDEVARAPSYDIYTMSSRCVPRAPLFSSSNIGIGTGHGVPIDCFYRLMSGKRLNKHHVLKAISVTSLQDCQEACIQDLTCRSISYRYMATGYTYNVANCELSPFYIVNYEDTRRYSVDFLEDYDYDYFQREPHCKTTSRVGSFGVCAVAVRQGAKLVPSLVKSTHQTSTATQCEFLCQTSSRFRCRAFSIRHTTRGRDPFHRDLTYESVCTLYDVDVSRLPQYDIVQDPDFDLYELGRLMGSECILQDHFNRRRPFYEEPLSRQPGQGGSPYSPISPTSSPYYPRIPGRDQEGTFPSRDYNHHQGYYPPSQRDDDRYGRPMGSGVFIPSTSFGSGTAGAGIASASYLPNPIDLPFYDPRKEACLVKLRNDVYLTPEVTRAQFPTKTLEECRVECIRSADVLRFSCRLLAYRLTSSSGGSCQLSEYYEKDLRPSDFVIARDTYERAVAYQYDESELLCRRDVRISGGNSYGGSRDDDRYFGGGSTSGYFAGTGRVSSGQDRYGSVYDRRPSYDYQRPVADSRFRDRDNNRYYGYVHGTVSPPASSYLPPQSTNNFHLSHSARLLTQTVNGERCLNQCERDEAAGFYYCIVERSGTWDFCCKPDHSCGYSRGLSVPWCYVGTGPTSQVWRSCNHRLLSNSLGAGGASVAYLHEGPPPQIHSLSTNELANLPKENALKLIKGSSSDFVPLTPLLQPESEFADVDGTGTSPSASSSGSGPSSGEVDDKKGEDNNNIIITGSNSGNSTNANGVIRGVKGFVPIK